MMALMDTLNWWERIRERRKALNLEVADAAREAGLSRQGWANIESGGVTDPRRETLHAIGRVLRMDVQSLYAGNVSQLAEEHAPYSVNSDRYKASLYERFAERYNAGDPETFLERVGALPFRDQEFIDKLARLLELERRLG